MKTQLKTNLPLTKQEARRNNHKVSTTLVSRKMQENNSICRCFSPLQNTHTHTTRTLGGGRANLSVVWRYCNAGGEGEGYGPLSMAVALVSLMTRQATCGITAHTFIPLSRPYQAGLYNTSYYIAWTNMHLTNIGRGSYTTHHKIK